MNQFGRMISIGIGLAMCVSIVAAVRARAVDVGIHRGYRNAKITNDKWSDGVIPYEFEVSTKDEVKAKFLEYIAQLVEQTDNCIKLVPRTNEPSYILIDNTGDENCESKIGLQSKQPQTVSLGEGCMLAGDLFHEVFHAIGFDHEHCRFDRNSYVDVIIGNVKSSQTHNFDITSNTEYTTLNLPYDYYSIMHYDVTSFTKYEHLKKPTPTMKILDANVEADLIGESQVLTLLDVLKVKKYFGCIPDTQNTLTITLKETIDQGEYVSVDNKNRVYADADDEEDESQHFEISFNSDSTVCLKSVTNQKYLSVDSGDLTISANKDDCNDNSAQFYMPRFRNGEYALRSKLNLNYITTDGNSRLFADARCREFGEHFIVKRI